MNFTSKSYDQFDLADPKSNFKSKFRNVPFDIHVDALHHDQSRRVALSFKTFLKDINCSVKGPIATTRYVDRFVYADTLVPPVRDAKIYRHTIKVISSSYKAIDEMARNIVPCTVNLTLEVMSEN